jgi:uridine phosphorylase
MRVVPYVLYRESLKLPLPISCMIPAHLLCRPDQVAETVLLPGNPSRANLIQKEFDHSEKVAENREFLAYTGTYSGVPVSVCSTGIGAPSAVIALEELILCGAHTFIRVGTCGALQTDIAIGDVIVPVAACRGEGTSQKYVPVEFPAVCHPDVFAALTAAAPHAHTGIVWTDDSFYINNTEYWNSLHILAVEMECSSLFAVSWIKSVKTGAILAVDGNLVHGTCKSDRKSLSPHEISRKAEKGVQREIKSALEAVVILNE